MKALDTNVVVRFLVQDDELQSKIVYKLFSNAEIRKESFYIPVLVLLETIWVLESVYKVGRDDLIKAISDLMLMPILEFEKQSLIREFINSSENSTFDLSDILIAHSANTSGCDTTLTFDQKAAKYRLFEHLKDFKL
jgi:predicted nucleic-acid-binding protein